MTVGCLVEVVRATIAMSVEGKRVLSLKPGEFGVLVCEVGAVVVVLFGGVEHHVFRGDLRVVEER